MGRICTAALLFRQDRHDRICVWLRVIGTRLGVHGHSTAHACICMHTRIWEQTGMGSQQLGGGFQDCGASTLLHTKSALCQRHALSEATIALAIKLTSVVG